MLKYTTRSKSASIDVFGPNHPDWPDGLHSTSIVAEHWLRPSDLRPIGAILPLVVGQIATANQNRDPDSDC